MFMAIVVKGECGGGERGEGGLLDRRKWLGLCE